MMSAVSKDTQFLKPTEFSQFGSLVTSMFVNYICNIDFCEFGIDILLQLELVALKSISILGVDLTLLRTTIVANDSV